MNALLVFQVSVGPVEFFFEFSISVRHVVDNAIVIQELKIIKIIL